MSTRKSVRSVTYLKTHAARLLDEINREQSPVVITQKGEARGVLLDPESYDRLRAAIGILKLVAHSEEAYRAGRWTTQDALFERLKRKLKARRSAQA